MDRRSFLTLLGAAAVSVALPEIWTPPADLAASPQAIKQIARVSAPADSIFDIVLCGKSSCSEVATFDVIDPNRGKLLALALIPVAPMWEADPAFAGTRVPDVFKKAWRIG